MLIKLQNWLMNVAAKWIWIAIMLPIRIILGLIFAVSKHMPTKVELGMITAIHSDHQVLGILISFAGVMTMLTGLPNNQKDR